MVGNFPNEDDRWRRLQNYYLNCIRQTDALVLDLLSELDDLSLTENTIIVMTADHGELGGAHGTHGKGSTAYQKQNHVPLIVAHPGYAQSAGNSCRHEVRSLRRVTIPGCGEVAERSKAAVLKVARALGGFSPRFRLLTHLTCPSRIQQP